MSLLDSAADKTSRELAPIQGADLDDPEDILWGAEKIGVAINKTTKAVYNAFNKGQLRSAVRKCNGELVGSRRALHRLIFGIE